jgi:L-methionine (R)-S-oxide reductase
MSSDRKRAQYRRIGDQLEKLFVKTADPVARMATMAALLHHKMRHFFWTGFYLVREGDLVVGPYQGSLACMVLLPRHAGVCWAGVDRGETVVVPDVHAFPGHIACDSRSRSEIVVPVRDRGGEIVAVLDVDAERPEAFEDADREGLEALVPLIHGYLT